MFCPLRVSDQKINKHFFFLLSCGVGLNHINTMKCYCVRPVAPFLIGSCRFRALRFKSVFIAEMQHRCDAESSSPVQSGPGKPAPSHRVGYMLLITTSSATPSRLFWIWSPTLSHTCGCTHVCFTRVFCKSVLYWILKS